MQEKELKMNMIEKVARAIENKCSSHLDIGARGAVLLSKAAIEAMREPTDEMINAAIKARPYCIESEIKSMHVAMIDVALKE